MNQKIPEEIELRLRRAVDQTTGIYPQKTTDRNGATTERTPWQEGWNAAVYDRVERFSALSNWYMNLSADLQPVIHRLLLAGNLSVSVEEGKASPYVNCNDLFMWGCADSEDVPDDQIPILAEMCANDSWGDQKWCCIQRQMQPQRPIVDSWKESGIWDNAMEALPHNPIDGECPPTCSIHRPEDAAAIVATTARPAQAGTNEAGDASL